MPNGSGLDTLVRIEFGLPLCTWNVLDTEVWAALTAERFGPSWLRLIGGYEMPYPPRSTVRSVIR